MYSLVTLPSAENLIASTSAYSSPFFTEFLPIAFFVIGVIIAAIVANGIIQWIIGGFSNFFGGKKDKYD